MYTRIAKLWFALVPCPLTTLDQHTKLDQQTAVYHLLDTGS